MASQLCTRRRFLRAITAGTLTLSGITVWLGNAEEQDWERVWEDDFEADITGWKFHFGEYGTGEGGEMRYAELSDAPNEVIAGEHSLKVVSHPKAWSNSIAYYNLALLDKGRVKVSVDWSQLDKHLDSIEFAFNRFTGNERIEGAFQHLVYPRPRWRYWSDSNSGREWKELGAEERTDPESVYQFTMILDFQNNLYEQAMLDGRRVELAQSLPVATSEYAQKQPPHTRVHFEHRPNVDERSTVVYDNVVVLTD